MTQTKTTVHHEEQHYDFDEITVVHPDSVALELDRLENKLKEKERELVTVQGEIKSLRAIEAQKDKALEELNNQVHKMDERLRVNENILEHKNLEIRKLTSDKKEALAAQFAAEAALRRLHMNQKDDESMPLASVIAPLEAEIRMYKNEVSALQEDKKALERLTKSKESALLEAERILRSALERALIVEEVQNQNFELRRQIEICQEENRILEKTNRQKVQEVEKLSQTIHELEEVVLAAGATANAVRDYKRQIDELNEEKRTLERELARAKVTGNRIATVVANEWKDDNDKVMPVKQWLEERRLMQAETQRLRDKLTVSERTAKAEAQLKEKLKLRLKTLEEGLKHVSSISNIPNSFCASPKTEKSSNNILGFLTSNAGLQKRSKSQPRASIVSRSSPLPQPNLENETQLSGPINSRKKNSSGDMLIKKGLWASRNKIVDSGEKENTEMKANTNIENINNINMTISIEPKTKDADNCELPNGAAANSNDGDTVSGYLYDRLQKEVINLRRFVEVKETDLSAKDQEIKFLMKKVEALTKAMEIESKRVKREAAAREKEATLAKLDDNRKNRITIGSCKRITK